MPQRMPESSESVRPKRCRTGCQRCRLRRRKCDEGKPRCRNCVEKGFRCEYGTKLTFLEKNAWTLESKRRNQDTKKYPSIEFVDRSRQSSPTQHSENRRRGTSFESLGGAHRDTATGLINTPPQHESASSASYLVTVTEYDTPDRLTTSEDVAANSLLSLSVDDAHRRLEASDSSVYQDDGSAAVSLVKSTTTSSTTGHVDEQTKLELLRHFRYELAPWLDICDQNQTFGILAIQAAMETTPAAARLLSSILALADISLRLLNSDGARQNAEYRLTRIDEDSRYAATLHAAAQDSTSILCLLSSCLDMVRRFILDVRGTWLEINFSEIERPPPAANERDWHLSTATYWLCLRLAVSRMLANGDFGGILSSDFLTNVPTIEPTSRCEQICVYANRPLFLCAQVFALLREGSQQRTKSIRESWLHLVDELQNWYRSRNEEFQPILEFGISSEVIEDTSSTDFPSIVFTSGAAIFGNQLYHTAMLVLLSHKPRTIQKADFRQQHPSIMSPLWHAQRICGIALNNVHREHWDPCLLSSFIVAARRMTHESQQLTIIEGLRKIQKLTGWNIDLVISDLLEEWRSMDGI